MPVDPQRISEYRKAQRDAISDPQALAAHNLGQIADTLEALRQEFVLFQGMLSRLMSPGPRGP